MIELEAALAAAERGAAEIAAQIGGETAASNAEIESASAAVQERAAVLMEEVSGLEIALSAAEQRANDAAGEACSLRERVEHLTAEASAAGVAVEEAAQRIASLEAEVDGTPGRGAMPARKIPRGHIRRLATRRSTAERAPRRSGSDGTAVAGAGEVLGDSPTRGSRERVNVAGDAFEFARRTNGHVETVERG